MKIVRQMKTASHCDSPFHITSQEKQELGHLIESYAKGLVPLVVPLTLLKHHLMTLDNPYLKQQTFWSPHPDDLGLRNFVLES